MRRTVASLLHREACGARMEGMSPRSPTMSFSPEFGRYLKQLLTRYGASYTQAGKATGLTDSYLHSLVNGRRGPIGGRSGAAGQYMPRPSLGALLALSLGLGLGEEEVANLFRLAEEEQPPYLLRAMRALRQATAADPEARLPIVGGTFEDAPTALQAALMRFERKLDEVLADRELRHQGTGQQQRRQA